METLRIVHVGAEGAPRFEVARGSDGKRADAAELSPPESQTAHVPTATSARERARSHPAP